jgi:hypothetical protein
LSEDALQVYEARCVSGGVEVAAPRALAPSFGIAVARVSAAGRTFAFEDEVDPAKVGRGVKAGVWRVVVNWVHDAPPLSARFGGWASGPRSDGSTELIPAPKRFLDEVGDAGGRGSALEEMFGDA